MLIAPWIAIVAQIGMTASRGTELEMRIFPIWILIVLAAAGCSNDAASGALCGCLDSDALATSNACPCARPDSATSGAISAGGSPNPEDAAAQPDAVDSGSSNTNQSCDDQREQAAAGLADVYHMTDKRCSSSDDCIVVDVGRIGCIVGCAGAIARTAQQHFSEQLENRADALCANFQDRGCVAVAKPCGTNRGVLCTMGQCGLLLH